LVLAWIVSKNNVDLDIVLVCCKAYINTRGLIKAIIVQHFYNCSVVDNYSVIKI